MKFFLLLLLSLSWAQETPESSVRKVFRIIDELQAQQAGQNARQKELLDRQCLALAPEVLRLGWRSVEPLSAVLRDRSRPEKTRLLAASFLGLTQDPLAFSSLRSLFADPEEPAGLRSSAVQSLPGLGLSKAARRRALCPLLAEKGLPGPVLTEALIGLEHLGCDDPALLEGFLESIGPRPSSAQSDNALRAVTALSYSLPPSAEAALLKLAENYVPGSPLFEAAANGIMRHGSSQDRRLPGKLRPSD